MADARQKQNLAYALAVTGRSVPAALRWLKSNTIEGPELSERTLYRLLKDEEFNALVDAQIQIVQEERDNATRVAERERLKREMQGSYAAHMDAMIAKGWQMFDDLSREISNADVSLQQKISFWKSVQGYAMEMRREAGGGINQLWQADLLIRSFREISAAEFGGPISDKLMRASWARFQEYAKAFLDKQAQAAEVTSGETQTAAALPASA